MTFDANRGFQPNVTDAKRSAESRGRPSISSRPPRTLVWSFLGLATVGLASSEAASRGQSSRQQSEAALERLASATVAEAAAIEEPRARAQAALQRGADDRAAGNPEVADLFDNAALEWTQVADDRLRAGKKEQAAEQLELELKQARKQLARARVLLEETQAQKGRIETQLSRAKAAEAKRQHEEGNASDGPRGAAR